MRLTASERHRLMLQVVADCRRGWTPVQIASNREMGLALVFRLQDAAKKVGLIPSGRSGRSESAATWKRRRRLARIALAARRKACEARAERLVLAAKARARAVAVGLNVARLRHALEPLQSSCSLRGGFLPEHILCGLATTPFSEMDSSDRRSTVVE